jgi:glycosyltransferase involved in cell wall biosynthesis
MISIVIPVHNQADKLDACLNSIMKQSYTDWELIVVNDGSTDAIEQAVSHWEQFLFPFIKKRK